MKRISARKLRRAARASKTLVRVRQSRPPRIFLGRILVGSIAALVSFSSVSKTQAATLFFDSDANGANGITESGGPFSWTPGTTPTFIDPLTSLTAVIIGAPADVYQFGGNGLTLLAGATVNITTGTAITGLIFGATGGNSYSLTASAPAQSLSIGTSGIGVNAGAFATSVGSANLGITLGGAQSWVNNSANSLSIGGAITNGTNLLTLQAQGAGDINVSGALTGGTAGGITVNSTGTGRVILSGDNTQTGTTTLTAGILRATTSANALGTGAAALQLNGGILQLADDTGLNFARNTAVGGNTAILSDRTTAGAGVTQTLGTLSLGAFTMNVGAGAFNTSGTAGLASGAATLTGAATINTNNSFTSSGVTTLTTLASLSRTTQNLTVGGTGNTTITGGDTGTTGALTKNGTGTLTLGTAAGTATYGSSGLITLSGGTINVTPSTTFTNATKPGLTFGGTGQFTFNSTATAGAATQSLGALSFTAGEGTVTSVFTTGVTSTALTFGSLAARTAGATGNFVTTAGANGTTNSINLTGAALGFQNQGLFFNGANYAYVNALGTFVRAPVYGTDANFVTQAGAATITGSPTAATHQQVTGAITAGVAASVATLKINSASAANFTQTTGTTLTLAQNGILRTGGSTTTIASTTTAAATLTGTGELVIRTNAAADAVTFSATNPVNITGFTGLTKTGAGTLTLGGTSNTFTGNININGGVLSIVGPTGTVDPTALGAAGARIITLNGGTFQVSSASYNPNVSTKTFVIGPSGGTFDTVGSLTLDDGTGATAQLSGSGNLTKIGTATLALGNGAANSFAGFTGNLFINAGTLSFGTITAGSTNTLGDTTGRTVIASGATFNLNGVIAAATTNEPLTISGTGLASAPAGVITNGSATAATFAGPITLAGDSTITPGTGGIALSGSIGDNGRGFVLTKNGATFLTLNGVNTYSGGTVINGAGSQLALGNNAALGTGSLTVNSAATGSNIVASTNLVMTNSVILNADTSFGLAGNGNVGNMTFGALNLGGGAPRTITVPVSTMTTTFTGAVTNGTGLTVTGIGTLALSGTGSFTGPVTNNGGGTLSLGSTTLDAVGSVSIGTTNTSRLNFNADNLGKAANLASNTTVTLGGAASQALLGFQLGNTSNYDSLNLSGATGNVTVGTAGAIISITPLTGFTPAPSTTNTYNLITTSGGGTISNFGNLTLPFATLPTGFTYTFTTSSTSAVLGVTAGAAGNLFWRGDVNGSWNGGAGSPNTNWNDSTDTTDALFTPNSTNTVNFSSTGLAGATPVTTTLDQNFSVAGITVNNTNTGALTVNQGTFGTLTLGTGGITVNTGGPTSTTVNAPIALSGAQTWTVTDAAQTLSIQGASPANGIVSGAFSVTLAGPGSVTLGGFNTFSGGLTTGAGPLNINNGGSSFIVPNSALGTGAVSFVGATTTLDNTSGVAQSVVTTGAQTWGGNVVFTGTNSLSLGAGTVNLGASVRTVTVNGGTLHVGGIVSGVGAGLIKTGTGALTLSGTANTFTAGVTLNNGRLNINGAAALGTGTFVIDNTGAGVTIDNTSGASVTTANAQTWTTDFTYGGSAPLIMNTGAIAAGATNKAVAINGPGLGINTNSLTIGGAINLTAGGLTKTGSGALILTNANAGFTGGDVTLNGGTLGINGVNALGVLANTLIINGTTPVALDTLAAGIVNTTANPQTWTTDFAFLGTGNLTMGAGAITAAAGTRTITVVQNSLTLGGAIDNTNTPAITVNGGGSLFLTGDNLYTGTTTINPGATLNLGGGGANGSLNGTTGTALVLNGGVFNYTRTGTVTQDMNGVAVGAGRSVILNTTATQTMALGAITRTVAGGTLDLRPFAGSVMSTSTINTVGILGGWAVFNAGASWAVGNGAGVAVTGLASFTPTSTAGTTAGSYLGLNIDVDNSAGLIDAPIAPNSLRFNSATGSTMTLAAGVNTIDSGGILVTPTAAAGTSTITGGSIAGAAGVNGDLIINHWGTTGALNINSIITDNPLAGSTTSLTKSGTITAANGIAVIGGSFGSAVGGGSIINTFTGSVFVDAGTLTVNGSSVTGGNLNGSNAGPLNQRPVILNGGTLNLVMDGDATGTANAIDLTAANTANSGVTVNGNAAINVSRLAQGTNLTAATPALFTTALNKTIKMGALSFGNDGRTLTIAPSNGYGLEFTGTTTLDKNLTTISIGTVTASNVVPGLTLSGKVTGTIAGGAWTKAGTGTLVLSNVLTGGSASDFTGNIVVTGGTLAFTAANAVTEVAALGNAANTITLNGGAGTGIRAYGGTAATPIAFGTARTINLWNATAANNVIEVAANTTFTLNAAFGSNNGPLTKADLGTLVLNADNGIWSGQLSISVGAVKVTNAGALGISTAAAVGNTIVAATGGALQLSGVSIWDQLNLIGSGINSAGALQALAGTTNTTNGFITLGATPFIGADSTAILNIRGGIGGAQALTFSGAGTINVDTTALGSAITSITKIGSGTTTLAVANPSTVAPITVNAGTLALGGSIGAGAGSVGGTGAITLNPGGTLAVDNGVGTGVDNRLGASGNVRPITLAGGNLTYVGNANTPSSETLGALAINRGESTITVTAGASAGAGLIFGTPALGTGGTALFRGSNLGSAPGNGVATIASNTTGFTFTGAGAPGTVTKGILPWALVDASASGTGTSFATADTGTGNLRALAPSEYVTALAGLAPSANFVLSAADRLAGSSTINSLTLTSTGAVTLNPMQTLTVGGGATLGGILNTAAATISGGLLTSGGVGGVVFHANANLTLDSVLIGSSGGSNVYLTKTGAGILTLNKVNPFIGQTAINQGTLKLAGGNNTLFYVSGNSFMAINGGTLDLNGNSQQVQGLFTDGAVAGAGGTIIGVAGSTLVTNSDARNWAGTIGGDVAFQRGGSATATTFYSDNTYSGATLISGGTITLQDSGRISGTASIGIDYGASLIISNTAGTQALTDRVRDLAAISLRGGILTLNGRANTNTTETVGVTTLTSGGSLISMGVLTGNGPVGSAELTVTRLDRAAGQGTVTFNVQGGTALGLIGSTNRIFVSNINGTSTSTLGAGLTNNIIGPWAVVNATDWASYNPSTGVGGLGQLGYAGYSNTSASTTSSTLANAGVNDNVNLDAAIGTSVLAADKTIGTLRIGNFATQTIDINAGTTLTLGNGISGGLLMFSTANEIVGTAPGVGNLTSGGSELFIFLQGAGNLTVNSVISGATTLIKSSDGAGTDGALILTGTNTYTGGTVVNVSGLTLAATGTLPAPTSGAGLTLNNGTFTQTAGGIVASQSFVLNGASTATLAGANSLTTLTFNVDGGAQTGPTVALGATSLTLTGAGGITAGGSNPNATAVISGAGTLNLNGATNFAMDVDGFSFNSQLVAPLTATLSITAPIANGGIVKTGDGLVSLGGANTFASGVDLQAGGIAIANNAAFGVGGTLMVSGNNTTLTADATGGRTVANSVTLGNAATSITLGNYGAGTLTLSGATTWSTATGVARTLIVNAVTTAGFATQTLGGVITSAGTGNQIIKQGIGTLAITANNAATLDWTGAQAVQILNGTLSIGADTALGATPGAAVADNIVINGGALAYSAPYTLNVNRGISLGTTNGVIDTSTFNVAIPGTIGGAGGLVKSGTGTLTLSGANTFSGSLFVNAGALAFTNATAATFTGLSVAGGAALSMLNNAGQTINLGSGALNLGAGAGLTSLNLELLNPSNYDSFTTTGAAGTANNVHLNLTRLPGATGGTFTLLAAAGGLNSATYALNPAGWGISAYTVSPTAVQMTATPVTSDLFWAGAVNLSWGGLNGSFDSNFSTDLAGSNAKGTPGIDQGLTFSANGQTATTLSTTLDINSSIRELTFSNTLGSGPLATVNIAPGVGGTLSITPAVSTAGINVQAGAPAAINISAPVILGANQTWSVADAATVLAVPGNITGTANLIKDGNGILELRGANTYVGTTTVTLGVLRAGAANGLNATSAFTVGATGTLRLNGFAAAVGSLAGPAGGIVENFSGTSVALTAGANNTSTSFAGTIRDGTGTGALTFTKVGTGALTITGSSTLTGNTVVREGTLNISGTGSLTGNTTATRLQLQPTVAGTSAIVNYTSSGTSTFFSVNGANLAGTASVLNQTDGFIQISPNTTTSTQSVVTATGAYGAYNISGGTFRDSTGTAGGSRFTVGDVGTASATNGTITGVRVGIVNVSGTGFIDHTNAEWWLNYSLGQINVTDSGKIDHTGSSQPFALVMNTTVVGGSYGVLNLAGTGAQVITGNQPLRYGNLVTAGNGDGLSAFVNLAAGTLSTGTIGTTLLPAAPTATNFIYYNYAGGTLKASNSLATGWTPTSGASATVINTLFGPIDNTGTANDFSGGLTVDTNGNPVTIPNNQPLLGATGFGVTQGNLTVSGGSGYIGAPSVTFSRPAAANGVAAAGYAIVSGGAVTGIVITDPGVYASSETPTIQLLGGFATGAGTAATVSSSALATSNVSGGLTKIGVGTLTLSGTGNTYTGGTTVTGGTLALGVSNALASTGNVTVNGGTFDAATFTNSVGTVSLQSGSITGSTGVITSSADYDVRSGNVNFSGAGGLAGSVGLTKTTVGTVTLSNANTFTNAVNVNDGTLAFSASNQLGNASATNTIGINGGTLSYTGNTSVDLTATRVVTIGTSGGTIDTSNLAGILTISGGASAATNGSLTKTGPGRAIITGSTNLGTGTVTVSNGTLQAGFGASGTSAINVGATGNLSMQNSIIEGLTLGNAAGALTLAGGARLGFEFDAATNDRITIGATGTPLLTPVLTAGVITLDLFNFGAGITAPNTYTLLSTTLGDLTNGGFTSYAIGTAPSGFNYSLTASAGTVTLGVVTFSPAYWTNSQGTGSWSTNSGPAVNFSTDAAGLTNLNALPAGNETVFFSANSIAGPTVNSTLDGNFTIYGLNFVAGSGTVATVAIDQGTSGTLTIRPSTGTGGIDVGANAGLVTIGAPLVASSTNSANQTWNVDGTGVNGSSLTLNGVVTFNANVIKTGAGTLTLGNAGNTGAGNFTLTGGTLSISANGNVPMGVFTIGAGTTINNTGGGTITFTNSSYNWNGDFTQSGQSVDQGSGAVTLGANVQATVVTNTLTVGGNIGDGASTFGLTKAGAGTLALTGSANSYNGATFVTDGTLSLTGALTGGGAVSTSGTGILSESSAGVISGASTVTQGSSGTSDLAGNNTHTGLTLVTAGALTLSGNNSTASGGVTLTAGQLNINNDNALGSGTLTLSGGVMDSTNAARTVAGNNVQTWSNGATVAFTGTNTLNLGTGAVTLGTDATVGSFTLTNNSALGLTTTSLTVGGNITAVAGGTAGIKTLTIGGAGSTLLSGNLSRGAASNLVLTNAATGTLKLSGTSTVQTLNITQTGGIVDLTGGNLSLANAGASSLLASNNATIDGGTITLTAGTAGTATTSQNYADVGATAGTLTINSLIAGNAGIGVDFLPGAGTVVLTNANTFSGPAGIFSTVKVTSIGDIGVAGNLGTGATLGTNAGHIQLGTGGTGGTLVYDTAGTGETTNRKLSLGTTTATNTIDMSGTGTLRFSATGNIVGTSTGAKTLVLQGSTAGIGQIDQNIVNTTNGGALVSVSKRGTGKWILAGTNTYTGATIINDGTLEYAAAGAQTLGALTFGSAAASTTVGALNMAGGNLTYTAGLVQTNSTSANTITVGSGATLTLSAGLTVGYAATAGSATDTKLTVNTGSMAVNGTSLVVGVQAAGANLAFFNRAVLDVTGLASFTTNVTNLNVGVGDNTVPTGTLLLSNTANLIQATTLKVGDTGGDNGTGTSTLTLGTGTNAIQADTIEIGKGKGSGPGVVKFATQTAGPGTVTIANKAGTGAANITVANVNGVNTGGGAVGTLDLRGHVATVNAGTLIISQANNAGALAGGTNGTVRFDAGTFTVATLNMAPKTAASTGTATALLAVGGGNFTVNTAFTLGSQATAGASVATLNLTGGTFTSNPAITRGAGAVTSTINLDGAPATTILDMTNDPIGTGTNTITLNAKQGTLRNLSQLNGGGALTKTTAGTLILGGANTYTGATNVTDGTVQAAAANAFSASSAVVLTDALGVILDLNGTNQTVASLAGGGTTGGTVTLGTTGTLTVSAVAGTTTFAGAINGGDATHGLTKGGASTQVLSGTNPYTGPTIVSGGTLEISGQLTGSTSVLVNSSSLLSLNNNTDNIVNSAASLTVADGTLALGTSVNDKVQNYASLALSGTGTSTLDFGTGANGNTFTFTAGGVSFPSGTLAIWNWSADGNVYDGLSPDAGTLAGDNQDRLLFASSTGFTPGQLANIQFFADAGVTPIGFGAAEINFTATGQLEIVPVPEPSSTALLGAAGLLALVRFRERRRLSRRA